MVLLVFKCTRYRLLPIVQGIVCYQVYRVPCVILCTKYCLFQNVQGNVCNTRTRLFVTKCTKYRLLPSIKCCDILFFPSICVSGVSRKRKALTTQSIMSEASQLQWPVEMQSLLITLLYNSTLISSWEVTVRCLKSLITSLNCNLDIANFMTYPVAASSFAFLDLE